MITSKQAYEWVKTGHWSLREFNEWFDAQRPVAEQHKPLTDELEKLKELVVFWQYEKDCPAKVLAELNRITAAHGIMSVPDGKGEA